jgi:hypothetical protein
LQGQQNKQRIVSDFIVTNYFLLAVWYLAIPACTVSLFMKYCHSNSPSWGLWGSIIVKGGKGGEKEKGKGKKERGEERFLFKDFVVL